MLSLVSRFSGASLLIVALSAPAALVPASDADAQYFGYGVSVRSGFGGVRVNTPGVGVNVGRFGGVSVNTPYYSSVHAPSRVYYGPRRVWRGGYRVTTPGYVVHGSPVVTGGTVVHGSGSVTHSGVVTSSHVEVGSPTPATGSTTVTSARPTLAAPPRFASEAELAAMSGNELLVAINQRAGALHARLDGFSGGAGWQTYLALDAAESGDAAAAEKMLVRYNSVARDGKFTVISQLDEFQAVRLALRILVDRGGVAATATAAPVVTTPSAGVSVRVDGEALPAPAANVDVSAGGVDVKVERSILNQQ